MTIEEYVNNNLSGAVLKGFTKDEEVALRLKKLNGRQFYVSFIKFTNIPEVLRVDIPVEGYVITFVGKLLNVEENTYVYIALEKAGILQRRTKPRYASFEKCSIYNNFKGVIIDISENGCQILSDYKPNLNETIEIIISDHSENGKVMWFVEEEENYRYGIWIPEPSLKWNELYLRYFNIGELL
ncbi:PilZ domain-containing protein [Fervidobacterium nodosum]|uniref:PilZ domain-containing protein n=1 Tax=Fervidobacterium nodosum (strain ATCC 35602 / DSM 5306 / Rt17-B1) TaxID=381764 RepID=A7HK11_FERNB|nr:PilZ domain-containing protein [Fervidobacterium nodosum]ABS60244.1 hypothetical protein Fnod_0379 [Fervidobacterium nodosum Rt17-B1]PHJ13415.1 pilus assembly protein PilZ [Fervidobacterium sp. SC_NGM5_G05]